VFIDNPYSRELRNHALQGKHKGYRSINVTGDVRAIYKHIDSDTHYFVEIGTHSELYS